MPVRPIVIALLGALSVTASFVPVNAQNCRVHIDTGKCKDTFDVKVSDVKVTSLVMSK